jgi:hypothetical protein
MIRRSMIPVEVDVRREMFRQVALAAAVILALCAALAGLSSFADLQLQPRAVSRIAMVVVAAWSFLRLRHLGTEPALGGALLTGLGGLCGLILLERNLP